MKYVIYGLVGLVGGIVGGFLGAKAKEWLDLRELKQMMEPFDENSCSCDREDGWDCK